MRRKPDIRAVIMAGGSGTRFWPLSRKRIPKQFLPIVGERTMIEDTADRVLPLIPLEKIHTVANNLQTRTIGRLLPGIPKENLIVEPKGKNTAPSLVLATARIYLKNPKAVVVVLPSDHLITRPAVFLKKLEAAAQAVASEDVLATFGIPPAYPSTGYGYIHFKNSGVKRHSGETFYPVEEFTEKPPYDRAIQFLKEGRYLWNSGIFVWRADVFARKLERFAPDLHAHWTKMVAALKTGAKARIDAAFEAMPSISIDYALMEKARGVLVCRGDFGWSDVGAWSSLADIWEKDESGNAFKGESIVLDSRNSLCFNPGRITALVGVKDLIVVNTKDALLVCRKDLDQKVRDILELLSKKGRTDYL
jgi:mannose-1-phosphate guanylyltransferase